MGCFFPLGAIGGSLLRGLDVDMLLTGELSHHDALFAIEQGQVVLARKCSFCVLFFLPPPNSLVLLTFELALRRLCALCPCPSSVGPVTYPCCNPFYTLVLFSTLSSTP
jgi:hypothetical protein